MPCVQHFSEPQELKHMNHNLYTSYSFAFDFLESFSRDLFKLFSVSGCRQDHVIVSEPHVC